MPSVELLRTPPEYRSGNGILAVTIEAQPTRVVIGGQTIDGATYNGDYGGPILRLKPGDRLSMHFVNHLRHSHFFSEQNRQRPDAGGK